MNKNKEKDSKTSRGQQKESQVKRVNKSPGKDNKRTPEEKSGGKPDDVSEKFPNFSLLTPEEKLVFFQALTTARKNVEKRGVRTKQAFGTVHDEYLQYFNQKEKDENEVHAIQAVLSGELSSSRISRSSGGEPETPDTFTLSVTEEETSQIQPIDTKLEAKYLDDCETVIQQTTEQILNLYMRKRKKNEDKASESQTKNKEPVGSTGARKSPQVQKLENFGAEKKKKQGTIGTSNTLQKKEKTPKFDELSTEERRIFFQLLEEARQNILEKNPEKKKDVVEIDAIMRGYQAGDPTSVYMVKGDTSKWPKEKKNLKVQVTVTSGDNERLLKTGQLKDFFQSEEKTRIVRKEHFDQVEKKTDDAELNSIDVDESFEKLLDMKKATASTLSMKSSSEILIPNKAKYFQDLEKLTLESEVGDIDEKEEEKKPLKLEKQILEELQDYPENLPIVKDGEQSKKLKRENHKCFGRENQVTEGKKPVNWERYKKGELPESQGKAAVVGAGRKEEWKKKQKPTKHDCLRKKSQVADRMHGRGLTKRQPEEHCNVDQRLGEGEREKESVCDVYPSPRKSIPQRAKNLCEEQEMEKKRVVKKKIICPVHPSDEECVQKKKENCMCEEQQEECQLKKKGKAREVHSCDAESTTKKKDHVYEDHLQRKKSTPKKKRENVCAENPLHEECSTKKKDAVEEHLSDKESTSKKKENRFEEYPEKGNESKKEKTANDSYFQVRKEKIEDSVPVSLDSAEYKVSKKVSNILLVQKKDSTSTIVLAISKSGEELRKKSKGKIQLQDPPKKEPDEEQKPTKKASCSCIEKKLSKGSQCEEKTKSEKESLCEPPPRDPCEEQKVSKKDICDEQKFLREDSFRKKPVGKDLCEKRKKSEKNLCEEKKSSQKDLSEEKKPSKKDLSEEKTPSKKDLSEEKTPSKKDLSEEKTPSKKDLSEEKTPSEKDFSEEKTPSKKDLSEEKKPSNKDLTEEKRPSKKDICEEKKPSKKDICEEKKPSKKDICEEKKPSKKNVCEEKQSEKDSCEDEKFFLEDSWDEESMTEKDFWEEKKYLYEKKSSKFICQEKKPSKKDLCEKKESKKGLCVKKPSKKCMWEKKSLKKKKTSKDLRDKKKASKEDACGKRKVLKDNQCRKAETSKSGKKCKESEVSCSMNKIMIVDDNVIEKIRKLILYLESKTKRSEKYEKEYMQLVVDYIDYLSKVLESLVHRKECQGRVQTVYAAPEVHLKFRDAETEQRQTETTETKKQEKIPRSISETGLNVFKSISPLSLSPEKKKESQPAPEPEGTDSSEESEDVEDLANFVPPIISEKKLVTTKIRLLQDLLRQRAEFVEGSVEDFKIVHHPTEEIEIEQKPLTVRMISEEDEETGPKEHKFLKALVKCFTCGRTKYEKEGVFENLKGEAVRVDVVDGSTKDPANITLNRSTMEVLRASARKKIIEKYYSKD